VGQNNCNISEYFSISKNLFQEGTGGVAQVIVCLPSARSSNPSPLKKKTEKKKNGKESVQRFLH
jgi:hypothetical protein